MICLHTVKWLKSSIWLIGGPQTGTSESGSNGYEGLFHILQSSRTGALP